MEREESVVEAVKGAMRRGRPGSSPEKLSGEGYMMGCSRGFQPGLQTLNRPAHPPGWSWEWTVSLRGRGS